VDPGGEDKMQQALEREGARFANIYDLARHYTEAFLDDWRSLNLREPEVRPRATEHVTDQLHAVIELMEKGHAYTTDKGVYFSVDSIDDYGHLSGNTEAEQLRATDRETVDDPDKKDPRDFALWKHDPDHLMHWHSPWGWGFPGWHIECSVMGMRYLGEEFDLHTGGEDLIFPHHDCEIAQNKALTGGPAVNYWVHTRFLQVEGEKMSKSTGNFYTVRDLIQPGPDDDHVPESVRRQGGVDPLALRYALLQGQYRKPFNFTLDTLQTAARHVQRFQDTAERVDEALEADIDGVDVFRNRLDNNYEDLVLPAMCSDLNTPVATAATLDGLKVIEREQDPLSGASARTARRWLDRINDLLGIVESEFDADERTEDAEPTALQGDHVAESIDELLQEREAARDDGEYARADAIRDTLEALGIEVMDRPEGPEWRRKNEL
jgi:cysteinyl-tRNA synthetase